MKKYISIVVLLSSFLGCDDRNNKSVEQKVDEYYAPMIVEYPDVIGFMYKDAKRDGEITMRELREIDRKYNELKYLEREGKE